MLERKQELALLIHEIRHTELDRLQRRIQRREAIRWLGQAHRERPLTRPVPLSHVDAQVPAVHAPLRPVRSWVRLATLDEAQRLMWAERDGRLALATRHLGLEGLGVQRR